MVRLSEAARITVRDADMSVDQDSPLESQARLVYMAARRFAEAQRFKPVLFENQFPGLEGPIVVRRLVSDLFPGLSKDKLDHISSNVGQVLRRTKTMVCTRRPDPAHRDSMPEWFIADSMPENLTVVALGVSSRNQNDKHLLERERKLTPQEAGETRPPGPVSTTFLEPKEPEPELPTPPKKEDHAALDEEIYEHIATSPVPTTVSELALLTGATRWKVNDSVRRLETEGRIHGRIETDEEGRVRVGGNGKPKAAHPRLWWPSEPVPIRTSLPPGIDPLTSSQEWADQNRELRERDEKAILAWLDKPPVNGRTSGKIAAGCNIAPSRARRLLDEMTIAGKLRRHVSGQYYPTDRPQRPRKISRREPAPAAPVAPPAPPAPAAAPLGDAALAIEQLVSRLVDERSAGVMTQNARLIAENEQLKAKRDELQAKLDKARALFE